MKTSCLIPCHNAYPHLLQCLQSLVRQFDEVIVYFDACSDRSCEQVIYLREHNTHLRLIGGEEQVGVQRARNTLFSESTGDLICFFDADDYRNRDSVQPIVQHFQSGSDSLGAVITPCNYLIRDPLYRSETYRQYPPYWMEEGYKGSQPDVWELIINRAIQTGGVMWRREALQQLVDQRGYVWEEERYALQDQHLLLDFLEMGEWEIEVLPLISHNYRWGWSESQITINRGLEYQSQIFGLMDRAETLVPEGYRELLSIRRIEAQKQFDQLREDYEKHWMEKKMEPIFD